MESTAGQSPSLIDGMIASATTPAPLFFGSLFLCAFALLLWCGPSVRRR